MRARTQHPARDKRLAAERGGTYAFLRATPSRHNPRILANVFLFIGFFYFFLYRISSPLALHAYVPKSVHTSRGLRHRTFRMRARDPSSIIVRVQHIRSSTISKVTVRTAFVIGLAGGGGVLPPWKKFVYLSIVFRLMAYRIPC